MIFRYRFNIFNKNRKGENNMKFLPASLDGSNLMILNIYYTKGSQDCNIADDYLEIVYKDIDIGKKYVEKIRHPMIEVYVEKPEYRNHTYFKHWIRTEYCDKYTQKNKDPDCPKVFVF